MYGFEVLGDLPLDIEIGPNRVLCDFENGGTNLSTDRFFCPIYGNDNTGAPEYRFSLTVKRSASDSYPLSPFHINILWNGVEIPGGLVYIGTQNTAFIMIFLIRSNSSDGPIVMYDDSPPFVLQATFESNGMSLHTIVQTEQGVSNRGSLETFNGSRGTTYNVIFSCRDYVPGNYELQFFSPLGVAGVTFEFFYDGVLQPALGGIGGIPSGTRAFLITAPSTRGDALVSPSVTGTPLIPL